jgi:hypothetical protein
MKWLDRLAHGYLAWRRRNKPYVGGGIDISGPSNLYIRNNRIVSPQQAADIAEIVGGNPTGF